MDKTQIMELIDVCSLSARTAINLSLAAIEDDFSRGLNRGWRDASQMLAADLAVGLEIASRVPLVRCELKVAA